MWLMVALMAYGVYVVESNHVLGICFGGVVICH